LGGKTDDKSRNGFQKKGKTGKERQDGEAGAVSEAKTKPLSKKTDRALKVSN